MKIKRMALSIFLLAVGLLLSAGSVLADQAPLMKLKGSWMIDYDRTLEYAKTSPKYTAKDAQQMPDLLKTLRNLMKIEVTATQVITHRGDRQQALNYTLGSTAADEVVLSGSVRGQEVVLTFTLMEGGTMNMRSSGTDDMDYFIWKPAP